MARHVSPPSMHVFIHAIVLARVIKASTDESRDDRLCGDFYAATSAASVECAAVSCRNRRANSAAGSAGAK